MRDPMRTGILVIGGVIIRCWAAHGGCRGVGNLPSTARTIKKTKRHVHTFTHILITYGIYGRGRVQCSYQVG